DRSTAALAADSWLGLTRTAEAVAADGTLSPKVPPKPTATPTRTDDLPNGRRGRTGVVMWASPEDRTVSGGREGRVPVAWSRCGARRSLAATLAQDPGWPYGTCSADFP